MFIQSNIEFYLKTLKDGWMCENYEIKEKHEKLFWFSYLLTK